jgi:2-polyprenyl-3-methyl-5-hydroxy-6-metoxy-1,4-benzoquinol methylase
MANLLSKLVAKLNPAAFWNKKYRTDEWVYTKVENRFVRELCEALEPGTAIDLAGGEGRNSMWLAKRGWTVENIDFSAVALKKFQTWVNEEALADASLAAS